MLCTIAKEQTEEMNNEFLFFHIQNYIWYEVIVEWTRVLVVVFHLYILNIHYSTRNCFDDW